jgi:hypothetical protein
MPALQAASSAQQEEQRRQADELIDAVRGRDADAVTALALLCADVNAPGSQGLTPLVVAAELGDLPCVQALLGG